MKTDSQITNRLHVDAILTTLACRRRDDGVPLPATSDCRYADRGDRLRVPDTLRIL